MLKSPSALRLNNPLGKSFRVRELTSTFRQGRLAAISYTTSIDGFADAVAELRHAYGDPARITRDLEAMGPSVVRERVVMQWENGRSTIRLTDPIGMGGRLRVTLFRDEAASLVAAKS